MQSVCVDKPSHVPEELVFPLDLLAILPEEDPHLTWKRIQETAPPDILDDLRRSLGFHASKGYSRRSS
jgi:hypothetical protein